jgi:hypothetical protein
VTPAGVAVGAVLAFVVCVSSAYLLGGRRALSRGRTAPVVVLDPAMNALTEICLAVIGVRAYDLAVRVVADVDRVELLGLDESQVLRHLASRKAEAVSAGTWDEMASAVAEATLIRHQRLTRGDVG